METEPLPGAISLEPGDDRWLGSWVPSWLTRSPLASSAPPLVLLDLEESSSLAASVVLPPLPGGAESPPALVDSPQYAASVQQDGETDETGIVGRADMQTLLRAAGQQEQIWEELSELRTLTGQLRLSAVRIRHLHTDLTDTCSVL